jgi:hypothetical protein
MPKSRTIRVTPNLEQCLRELKSVMKELPPGEGRNKAAGALTYLEKTFKGERQPLRGSECPKNTTILR